MFDLGFLALTVVVSQGSALLLARRIGKGGSAAAPAAAALIHAAIVLMFAQLPARPDGSLACGAAGALVLVLAVGGALVQAVVASLLQIAIVFAGPPPPRDRV